MSPASQIALIVLGVLTAVGIVAYYGREIVRYFAGALSAKRREAAAEGSSESS